MSSQEGPEAWNCELDHLRLDSLLHALVKASPDKKLAGLSGFSWARNQSKLDQGQDKAQHLRCVQKTSQVDYAAAFVHADIDLPPNYQK